MLFNSHIFILFFLPIVFAFYFLLRGFKLHFAGKLFLVLASFVFYAWWKTEYLFLLSGTIIWNFMMAEAMHRWRSKVLLSLAVCGNISVLTYFKYKNFFFDNISGLIGVPSISEKIIIPLGVSFYTFQQISFLVDTYRGKAIRSNLLDYTLFVSFFPQLVAGPISYQHEITPLFNSPEAGKLNYQNTGQGFFLFSMGLFKKVVIADSLAPYVQTGFDKALALPFWDSWATSLAYTCQLYFDFSGYTDMALGLGLLFNITLPNNFNSPYKSLNIQEFWRRWHITLGRFVRDYIYIPLGGSRKGSYRTLTNLFSSFLLIGLWHGAGWNFVLWGGLHGIAMVVHRIWQNLGGRLPAYAGWLLTFLYVNACWVLFRATTTYDAIKIYKGMLGVINIGFSTALTLTDDFIQLGVCIGLIAFTVLFKNSVEIAHSMKFSFKESALAIVFFLVAFIKLYSHQTFLYFDF
ncbi:MBOAT family protein [Desulfovibrio sp. UCD-KL4C]|uniref:MBOAT family O-acyltransferase n=1 Tax=Desulfovibrio sp. UCD-KL4C TaxID=2578120 RepID=UPI0025C1A964|nr:MBOAT family O-acyltransferase [Desulfovibrio sp. UCD-KL4C]